MILILGAIITIRHQVLVRGFWHRYHVKLNGELKAQALKREYEKTTRHRGVPTWAGTYST